MTKHLFLSLGLFALTAACSSDSESSGPDTRGDAAGAAFVLQTDPGNAESVADTKRTGPSEDVRVVEGRVYDITKGFAVLKLMGTELHYCGEVRAEGCKTPWDYCCDPPQAHREHSLLVEFRGADGTPVETAGIPDLRLLDLVKVRGSLRKDEYDNLVFVADGVWKVARPLLPEDLDWPE